MNATQTRISYRCLIGPVLIRVPESLCAATVCSTPSRVARAARSPPMARERLSMQYPASERPRILLLGTSVNKDWKYSSFGGYALVRLLLCWVVETGYGYTTVVK